MYGLDKAEKEIRLRAIERKNPKSWGVKDVSFFLEHQRSINILPVIFTNADIISVIPLELEFIQIIFVHGRGPG